ncbi:MAG: shufflon system plasmid conjugative transfer pilus tip adhesin PilV, partial [Muribaculaceae bacterium]|nr:shufflon system plasmid conjugative transfer pilus tip adhesin PilV [Muribaculaceae bacterium]
LTSADFGNYLYSFDANDFDPAVYDGYYAGMTTKSGITSGWWHILSMSWGTTNKVNNKTWASQLALPTRDSRGLRYRTGVSSTAYSDWITVLDASNYSNYALPLSGGTMNGRIYGPEGTFTTQRSSGVAYIRFERPDHTTLGELGSDGDLRYWHGSAWRTVWHENNDGSGSGLDADLLDGYHRSNLYQGTESWMTSTSGLSATIDLTSSTYNQDTFYPVVGSFIPYSGMQFIKVCVQLNSGSRPSWSTHNQGFTCNMELFVTAGGWGTTAHHTLCRTYYYAFCDRNPCGYTQMYNNSRPVLWLRGGGKYFVRTDFYCDWSVQTSAYTVSQQTVQPQSGGTAPFSFNYTNLYANIQGNAYSADKLATTRYLWGQSFDGTGNVDGAINIHTTGNNAYNEGVRVHSNKRWSSFMLMGDDNTTDKGTSAKSWGLFNYDGDFYLNKNNSSNHTGYEFCNVGGNWGFGTVSPSYKLDVNGDTMTRGWFRTSGATGWYSETYGGGWHMSDSTWIRAYNGKSIYTSGGIIRTDYIFDRQGYGGSSWNYGIAAYNVAITDNNHQTPLFMAYRSGENPTSVTSGKRLFAMEFLNNATELRFTFGSSKSFIMYSSGSFYAPAGIWSDGYISARGQNTSSDLRLKNIIKPVNLDIHDIADAPCVEFTWKADGRRDIGSIAQHFHRINPLLTPEAPDRYLSLQYGKTAMLYLIPTARKVIQLDDLFVSVRKKVDRHEEEIEELKKENRELRRRIKILERR